MSAVRGGRSLGTAKGKKPIKSYTPPGPEKESRDQRRITGSVGSSGGFGEICIAVGHVPLPQQQFTPRPKTGGGKKTTQKKTQKKKKKNKKENEKKKKNNTKPQRQKKKKKKKNKKKKPISYLSSLKCSVPFGSFHGAKGAISGSYEIGTSSAKKKDRKKKVNLKGGGGGLKLL